MSTAYFRPNSSHLGDFVFDRRFHWDALQVRPLRMMERKFRIEGPDFQMRIDDQPSVAAWIARTNAPARARSAAARNFRARLFRCVA